MTIKELKDYLNTLNENMEIMVPQTCDKLDTPLTWKSATVDDLPVHTLKTVNSRNQLSNILAVSGSVRTFKTTTHIDDILSNRDERINSAVFGEENSNNMDIDKYSEEHYGDTYSISKEDFQEVITPRLSDELWKLGLNKVTMFGSALDKYVTDSVDETPLEDPVRKTNEKVSLYKDPLDEPEKDKDPYYAVRLYNKTIENLRELDRLRIKELDYADVEEPTDDIIENFMIANYFRDIKDGTSMELEPLNLGEDLSRVAIFDEEEYCADDYDDDVYDDYDYDDDDDYDD